MTVPRAPITIRHNRYFHVLQFFQFLSQVKVLILLFTFIQFLWSDRIAKSTIRQVLFFCRLIIRSNCLAEFVSRNPSGDCASHSPGQMLSCAYTICSYGQIRISGIVPSRSPFPPSRVYSYILSVLFYCIRLICDWWFRLYHYIYCFVASYLFLLWYGWSLWRCFVMLLEEILFLS